MPREYKTERIQPAGKHNPPYDCILASEVSGYLDLPFTHLNPVQTDFTRYLEDDSSNIVVGAPTSSGKTLCAELFASRALNNGKKILYIAPMKALTDEKYDEWSDKSHSFSAFHIEILTGDFKLSETKRKSLERANIIFMTPEMFNSKCRFYESHIWLHNSVIIVDECHLIGSKERGDKLEIGLMQYFEHSPLSRALFLSATIPNIDDFGNWLQHITNRESIIIESTYRPCKLTTHFVKFSDKNEYGNRLSYGEKEKARLEAAYRQIMKLKDDPTLVFVGSKDFGRRLSERLERAGVSHQYHNADLTKDKRNKIEKEFKNLDYKVLIATPTLAWGCNTPARNVLLCHTAFGMTPMPPADYNQSIGRAGRFGYADEGDAYVLVGSSDLVKEQKRLGKNFEVDSCLNDINNLMFHVLSYIVGKGIRDATDLYRWYQATFSYVQMKRRKELDFDENKAANVLKGLAARKMIRSCKDFPDEYEPTEMGEITARMYMSPLDVSDWFSNLTKLDTLNPSDHLTNRDADLVNIGVANAFANCYSWGKNNTNPSVYISKAEAKIDLIMDVANKMDQIGVLPTRNLSQTPHVKYTAIFYALLSGKPVPPLLQSSSYGIQRDIERIISTLKQVDERYGKYYSQKEKNNCQGFGWGEEWTKLNLRLRYPGAPSSLYGLLGLSGIGMAYAEKLYSKGVKGVNHLRDDSKKEAVVSVLGLNKAIRILEENNIDANDLRLKANIAKKAGKKTKKKAEAAAAKSDLF